MAKRTVRLTVEWDPESWEATYGTPPAQQRADVLAYVVDQVNGSAAAQECKLVAVRVER